jgi:hypothetical protein
MGAIVQWRVGIIKDSIFPLAFLPLQIKTRSQAMTAIFFCEFRMMVEAFLFIF